MDSSLYAPSVPTISSTTVPGISRTSRKTAMLTPKSAGTIDSVRTRTYRRTGAASRYLSRRLLPLEPHRPEAVVGGGEVLLVLERGLGDVDHVGRERPDLRRPLDHQPLRL